MVRELISSCSRRLIPESTLDKYLAYGNMDVELAKRHLRIQAPHGTAHGTACQCSGCQIVRDPSRQTGTIGEYFITSDEYKKLKDEEFERMRLASWSLYEGEPSLVRHPPGCDCKKCDCGH